MKKSIKRKIYYTTFILLLSVFFLGYFYSNFNINSQKTKDNIAELREQHSKYLENSPFKETLKLSKKERKAIQLPPNKYYEREWELTMNPATGKPEPNKVIELQKKLRDKSIAQRAPGDGAVGNDWVDRGPNNVGGRTRVVLFDPNDTNNQRVYAGGVSGGLWVNQDITNANSVWTLVSGVPSNMNISCITVDPRNPFTWYIGTGEQYTAGAAVGNGVYKTTDGGVNWVNVPVQLAGAGDLSSTTDILLSGLYYINDIVAWDNGTSTEVFIGVGGHLYGDASNPSNWLGLQSAGLYRTVDDGLNWNRIEPVSMKFDFSGFDFYFIPNDFEISADNTLWMGTITSPGVGGNGGGRIYNSSDGSNWNQVTTLTTSNRVELAVSTSNANKLYALTQGDGTDPHIFSTTTAFSTTVELAKPSDADLGISSSDFTRGQAFYDLVIEVDPTNDNIVYVGGIDLFRTDQGENTNIASEWKQISKWSNNANLNTLNCSIVHADQHAFTFRPGSNNEAVIGCDGGVYYASSLSTAQTTDVFTAMNKEYNVTQFYFGGYGPSTSNELIVAGAQDNGSQFVNGAVTGTNASQEVFGGDGAYSTIDKDGNYMVVSYIYSNHYYFDLPFTGAGFSIDNNDSEGDFINPAGLDHNLNMMYSNGSDVSKKINRYTLGSSNATKDQLTHALLDGSPTAFKVSPYTTVSSTLLVGTDNGKLLKLINANSDLNNVTWVDITGEFFVGSISSIEFGATENDIFVTFHNYGVTSIFYTSNGGTTWKRKEGTLPDMPVKSLLQNPLARNEVIIGTELGIWTSKNFNEDSPKWVSSTNGMRDVKVVDLDLRTSDNSILATTFGRGTFTGQFTSDTDPTFTISSANSIENVCKPNDAVFTFDFTALGGYNSSTTFSSSGAPAGATITFNQTSLSTTGTFTMTVGNTTALSVGEYTIVITGTGAKTISTDVVLIVNDASLGTVTTIAPLNGDTGISIDEFNFTWNVLAGATSYDIDIATDAGFNTIIESGEIINNSYSMTASLNLATVYYWRVRGKNFCVLGEYAATQYFQTAPLNNCANSTNNNTVSIADAAGGNPGTPAESVINVSSSSTLSDVNVSIDITHTCVGDLVISLIAPDTTEIVLFNNECWTPCVENMNVTYDDQSSETLACTSPLSGTIKPTNSLAAFNGKNANGNWTLKVVDGGGGDVGTINSWSIEVCESQTVVNSSFTNNIITVSTNSTQILKQLFIEASSVGSTVSQQVFMLTELPIIGEVRLSNVPLLLGATFTQDDINTGKITFVNTSSVDANDQFKVNITNATGGFLSNQQINIVIDSTYVNNDEDEDGVLNDDDICPNTPIGTAVDATGCPIFTLPSDNFNIEVISETCPDKDNGQLIIEATETYDYEVNIAGTLGFSATQSFTDNYSFENLVPDVYTVCITITGETYEQCFTVEVLEGTTVSGKSSVTSGRASVEITTGTAPYIVMVNGKELFETSSPVFNVDVQHGDLIEVKTAVTCEGIYSKTIELLDTFVAYPNPTYGNFEITIPVAKKEVTIELYSIHSQLISVKTYPVIYGKVQLNIENQPVGMYIAKIYLDHPIELKILKK